MIYHLESFNKSKYIVLGGPTSKGVSRPSSLEPRVVCLSVQDSQRVLLPGSSGLLPDGRHGMAHSPHVLIQSLLIREALGVTTSTNKEEIEVFPHVAKDGLRVLIDNYTVWTEASCLHFPPMLIDCLTRHSCWWKLVKRNSLSMPTRICRGTTAVRLGGSVLTKVDRATRRCFSRPSGVYKGTQSPAAVNLSG